MTGVMISFVHVQDVLCTCTRYKHQLCSSSSSEVNSLVYPVYPVYYQVCNMPVYRTVSLVHSQVSCVNKSIVYCTRVRCTNTIFRCIKCTVFSRSNYKSLAINSISVFLCR